MLNREVAKCGRKNENQFLRQGMEQGWPDEKKYKCLLLLILMSGTGTLWCTRSSYLRTTLFPQAGKQKCYAFRPHAEAQGDSSAASQRKARIQS